jgi:hypothetical protein
MDKDLLNVCIDPFTEPVLSVAEGFRQALRRLRMTHAVDMPDDFNTVLLCYLSWTRFGRI